MPGELLRLKLATTTIMAKFMSKLRKAARGRECQIRIGTVCNGNPETTVLCHLPGGGMGMKRHDLLGAWGCSSCHSVVDGAVKSNYTPEQRLLFLLDGMIRTQEILLKEGLIKCG